jgi:hypothetical protein
MTKFRMDRETWDEHDVDRERWARNWALVAEYAQRAEQRLQQAQTAAWVERQRGRRAL